jgi:hypothetical protein
MSQITDTPEEYFMKNSEYIRHYYEKEAESRRIRTECIKIAQAIIPQGVSPEKLLEYSNKLYNWILKNGKEQEVRS